MSEENKPVEDSKAQKSRFKDLWAETIGIELRSEEFQEVLSTVPPWILRWGITTVATIVVVLLIGSAIFKYPDTISSVVTLTGTTPVAGIVAKTSGKMQELYVHDNQQVVAGSYLAIIENPARVEDILQLKHYLQTCSNSFDSITSLPPRELSVGNLQSLYSSFYITLSDYFQFKELNYHLKKIEFMRDRIRKNETYYNNMLRQEQLIRSQLSIAHTQYQRDSTLYKANTLSKEEFERAHSQYLQGFLSWENMQASLENLQIQLAQMQENLLDTEYQYSDKKRQLETQLKSQITQFLTEIQSWEMTYVLIAPISGKITFTNYWTTNQNIAGGETVFNIVPDDEGILIGKALLPTERSGKVKTGQKVNIRFANFPDNEFGIVRGFVQNISLVPAKETNTTNYVVEIQLPEGLHTTYKKDLPFLPEMTGQADIITDDLSLLERLLLPLRKIITENI